MQEHPYRNVCDLRRDATTSLIELEYTTHTAEESTSNDRVPSGLPYASIDAHMQRLDVVFLSRFLFEILRYINLMLAMQPIPLDSSSDSLQAAEQSRSSGEDTATVSLLLAVSSFCDCAHHSILLALGKANLQYVQDQSIILKNNSFVSLRCIVNAQSVCISFCSRIP